MGLKLKKPEKRAIKSAVIQYFLIVLVYIAHTPWFYVLSNAIYGAFCIGITGISLAFMFFKKSTRERNLLPILMLMLISSIFMEIIFSGFGGVSSAVYNIVQCAHTILIGVVAYKYDKENFATRYVKIVFILAIISLAFYVACLVDYKYLIQAGILTKTNLNRLTFTNFYCNVFYALREREVYRNCGMFSEPGLYQIVLVGALYLLVFYSDQINLTHKNWMILVLVFTIITTGSGTGFIALGLILIGVLFLPNNNINKHARRVIGFTTAVIIILVFYDSLIHEDASFID